MPTTFTPQLSREQIEGFARDGYAQIDRITSAEEIEWFSALYDRILENPFGKNLRFEDDEAPASGDTSRTLTQVLHPEDDFPEILETQFFGNARRLACTLLGVKEDELTKQGTMLIFKPPRTGRSTPWHQDEAYWDQPDVEAHTASVWMPLEEATVDSGCMQFVPGSHKLGIMHYHQPAPAQPLLLDDAVDLSGAVACPLPPGGATFHYCRTLHYTGPNVSVRVRRAISAVFHGPVRPLSTPIERPWLPLQVATEAPGN